MYLQEYPVHPGGHGGPGQCAHKSSVASRTVAGPSRKLNAVGGIKNDQSMLPHEVKRAHIHYQVIVAKGSAPLSEQNLLVACGVNLGHHVSHVPGSQKLALF